MNSWRVSGTILLFIAMIALCGPLTHLHAGPHDGLPVLNEDWDRSTPRRSMRQYLDACRDNDYLSAAYYMDLSGIPRSQQQKQGPELAWKLKFVLDRTLWVDYELISDEPTGKPEDGARTDKIGEIELGRRTVPVLMSRVWVGPDQYIWLISAQTVQQIPELYRVHGAGRAPELLDPVFFEYRFWELYAWQWVGIGLFIPLALLLGWLLSFPLLKLAQIIARRTNIEWDDIIIEAARWPVRVFLTLILAKLSFNYLKFSVPVQATTDGIIQSGFILTTAWMISRFVSLAAESLRERLKESGEESLQSRGARTQLIVLRRVINIILYMIAGALILTQFEVLREIGMSLLASAGVAGLVIGLAAQNTISNLLSGIQLAITQPIRIGDTVIVEGEWGWIEEINLTYVVVKVWDLRRLVVPIKRFLDSPFQNWTKVSPEILGTVYFYTDYTAPIDKIREELERYVKAHNLFNDMAVGLVVTDVKESTLQIRALVSAADSGKLWDLRCAVREHMIQYIQQLDNGKYLPRTRLVGDELTPGD